MFRIVISYRRSDSASIAGRIFDRLCGCFGDRAVFMDIEAIPYGTDFRQQIGDTLASAGVMLALIGRDWTGRKAEGGTRINDVDDPVRVEVETALKQSVPLIPVLVDGGRMPAAAELPESLHPFVYLNAAPVDIGRDFRQHTDRLIHSIEALRHSSRKRMTWPARTIEIVTDAIAGSWRQTRTSWVVASLALAAVGGATIAYNAPPNRPAPAAVTATKFPGAAQATVTFPGATGRVTDEVGYLSDQTRQALSKRLAELQAKTSVQVFVAVLRRMPQTRQAEYAEELARRWTVGGEQRDGALLIVYPTELRATLNVGVGAPDRLKTRAHLIAERTSDRLRANDVVGGLLQGVDNIAGVLTGDITTLTGTGATLQPVKQTTPAPLIYRVEAGVSGGHQNLRTGPGTNYRVLKEIPEGSSGITIGVCQKSEDGVTKPWCTANWQSHSGWISSCCIVNETDGAGPPIN